MAKYSDEPPRKGYGNLIEMEGERPFIGKDGKPIIVTEPELRAQPPGTKLPAYKPLGNQVDVPDIPSVAEAVENMKTVPAAPVKALKIGEGTDLVYIVNGERKGADQPFQIMQDKDGKNTVEIKTGNGSFKTLASTDTTKIEIMAMIGDERKPTKFEVGKDGTLTPMDIRVPQVPQRKVGDSTQMSK